MVVSTEPSTDSSTSSRQEERDSLCLAVRRRSDGPDDGMVRNESFNLFARLPLDIVQQLHSRAVLRRPFDNPSVAAMFSESMSHWEILDEDGRIDFLPLAIAYEEECGSTSDENGDHNGTMRNKRKTKTIYASYNGGLMVPPGSSHYNSSRFGRDVNRWDGESNYATGGNEIDLPPDLFPPGSRVETVRVWALPYILDAMDVLVEPVAPQDWVLLQSAADWLEQGGLLRQVSIIYPNQIVPLHLKGLGVAHVRIGANNFRQRKKDQHGLDGREETTMSESWPCLRLVANTQIIIQPKEPESHRARSSVPLRLYPGYHDYVSGMRDFADLIQVDLVRVSQGTVAIHPDSAFGSLGDMESCLVSLERVNEHRTSRTVVRVVVSDQVPRDSIVMHPVTRIDLELRLIDDLVVLGSLSFDEEMEVCNNAFTKLLDEEKITISLERVRLVYSTEKPCWRFPDSFPLDAESTHQEISNDAEQHEISELLPPPHLRNIPLRVGGLFCIPWDEDGSRKQVCRYFRLRTSPNKRARKKIYAVGRTILAHHLESLLPQTIRISFGRSIPLRDFHCFSKGMWTIPPIVPGALKMLDSDWQSVIMCGGYGSGKTYTSLALGAYSLFRSGRRTVYLDCQRLKDDRSLQLRDILEQLCSCCDEARSMSPSIFIIDDLDVLIPTFGSDDEDSGSAHVQHINPALVEQCHTIESVFCHLVATLRATSDTRFVVSCRDGDRLPPAVRSALADVVLSLPDLGPDDRSLLFRSLINKAQLRLCNRFNDTDLLGISTFVGKKSRGFRPRDIEQLAARSVRVLSETNMNSVQEAIAKVVEDYVPLGKLSVGAEQPYESNGLVDVGGLFNVKRALRATVVNPSTYERIYSKAKMNLPRGILLFSEPGTGKSFLVPALAKECDFPLIVCRGPEMLDKYIGASEMKIRELFARAASVAPSILWIDEIDSLAPRRGSDSTGVTDRIVNQLLTFLDGVEISSSGPIYVIATSSRPDKIDPALLRPGRLERHIYLGLPTDQEEWTDLCSKIAARYDVSDEVCEKISSGQLFLALEENGLRRDLSAADLNSVFNTAQLAAAHEILRSSEPTKSKSVIGFTHLLGAFRCTKPSLAPDERQRLAKIYEPFRQRKNGTARSLRPEISALGGLRVALR